MLVQRFVAIPTERYDREYHFTAMSFRSLLWKAVQVAAARRDHRGFYFGGREVLFAALKPLFQSVIDALTVVVTSELVVTATHVQRERIYTVGSDN